MAAILICYFHIQQTTFKIGNINFQLHGIQLLIKNMVAAYSNEFTVKTTSA